MWTHRRTEEPSCTEVECFWKKPRQKTRVGMTLKYVTVEQNCTKNQCDNPLWHELRFARITASKDFDVSRCQTTDGSLVAAIVGAKTPDTPAMKRGRRLERSVIKYVQNILKKRVKPCGLFLSPQYPMIAAYPDGICKDAVIEVKCPTSESTKTNYIHNGSISEKYQAQIQLQMFVTKMRKGNIFPLLIRSVTVLS
ncbi:hypothetical protein ACJJTC_003367 [Scirpophaga incertulas]